MKLEREGAGKSLQGLGPYQKLDWHLSAGVLAREVLLENNTDRIIKMRMHVGSCKPTKTGKASALLHI